MTQYGWPKVSIVTVCFNESPNTFRYTATGIIEQTYPYIEWIVIDGGSKQETIDAINDYSAHINSYISEPDDGIYDAMNKGLSLASGDFVIFMNVGDRFYTDQTIEQATEIILANPEYDCFYGDVVIVDDSGRKWAGPQIRKVNRCILKYSMVCHQSIISRRSLYDTIGFFDISYRIIADRDWVLRSIDAGAKWLFMNMFISYYDRNGVSSDVAKRDIESNRFAAANYNRIEDFICFFFRKYRNLKQRIRKMMRYTYKGLPVSVEK